MRNKVYSGPLRIPRSYNMNLSSAYRHRRHTTLNIKQFLSNRLNPGIKNGGYTLLIAVMLITISIVILPSLVGCRFEAIRSGSMSPAINTGSLVITQPVNPYSIDIGDVIAYHPPSNPDTLVVHRVAGIDNGSPLSFRTKGDANDTFDSYLLPAESVVGQVKYNIPWIGYLVGFIQSSFGFILLLAIPGVIILYSELNKLLTLITPEKTNRVHHRNNSDASAWRIGHTASYRSVFK